MHYIFNFRKMDFSLHGKVTARQAILDRERAVATARNPALSKYGSTLMAIGLLN
jgi:hypothetical protein